MSTERSTSDWYRTFGEVEARGQSAIYDEWALGVAGDTEVLELIDGLPLQKRQPNLVFATARLLGSPEGEYSAFRAWLLDNWPRVSAETQNRMTQTNEPRRCAALLPALAALHGPAGKPGPAGRQGPAGKQGPLALLEIGASAGLCLYPDQYSYRYGDGTGDGDWLHPASGPSRVLLEAETVRPIPIPIPAELPTVAWRAGIDLEPLEVRDAVAMHWLETLVWPEQDERRARIRAAIEIVRADPPLLVRGNAVDELAALAAQAPADATLVIITSGVLVYIPYLERMRLVSAIKKLGVTWVSLEGVRVVPEIDAQLDNPQPGRFVLARDGKPLAYVGPHGQSVEWLQGA